MNNTKKSIVYVNFAPYVNAGNILDYLLDTFPFVIVYCFNFHKLGQNQEPSKVTIYGNKKIISSFPLYQTPTPASLVFFMLPLRSVIIFIQLFIHTLRLKKDFGAFDYYFTVNAFAAWCGNILRNIHCVKKTIFWVWDYYPPKHSDLTIRVMRWLYWQFDKPATIQTDKVVFLNHRMADLRKQIGILPRNFDIQSIGIGTNPHHQKKRIKPKKLQLVFFGVVKKRHGLDLIFDSAALLTKTFPDVNISIIGGGPDLQYYKDIAKKIPFEVTFHGFIADENDVNKLIQDADIGIATYTNDESNVSQYTDPSKIKRYISNGIPVIATDVFEFSGIITEQNAGIIIHYSSKNLVQAVKKIKDSYDFYQKGAVKLAKQYSYKRVYSNLFTEKITLI